MPIFPEYGIIFIHIPKTGGSFVENVFRKSSSFCLTTKYGYTPWTDFLKKGQYQLESKNYSLQHWTLEDLMNYFIQDKKTIKEIWYIIRHPVSRLVSEYMYLKYHVFCRHSIQELEHLFGNKIHYLDMASFTSFCLSARMILQECPEFMDNHFEPQSSFIQHKEILTNVVLKQFQFEKWDKLIQSCKEVLQTSNVDETVRQPNGTSSITRHDQKEVIELNRSVLLFIADWYQDDFTHWSHLYSPFDMSQIRFPSSCKILM